MPRASFLRARIAGEARLGHDGELHDTKGAFSLRAVRDLAIIHHPHDGYFKAFFSVPEHAAEFFRRHLPPEVVACVDWLQLENVSAAYLSDDLQASHADLVFAAPMGGRRGLVHFIFEHQTTVDEGMPLRLASYTLSLLTRHRQTHGLPLPPVVTFVLHQGPERWTAPCRLRELFDIDGDESRTWAPLLPDFTHGLLDLTTFEPDSADLGQAQRVVLQLMKMAREKRVLEFFDTLAAQALDCLSDPLLHTTLVYALSADPTLDLQVLVRKLSSNTPVHMEALSIAQKLLLEGQEKGLERGYGLGVLKTCVRLAEKRFGALPAEVNADVERLPYPQLEALSEALLDFGSLADLREWLGREVR